MRVTLLSDAELVARCRRQDQDAWKELVERFSRYVWAIASSAYRLSDTEAEDVFQEVFARTFVRLDSLRSDEAIRPWLGQLCRRLCVDRIRARRPELPVEELPEMVEPGELERLDEALTVRDALRTVPEHCQDVLDRFFTRDESYEVIGAALEIPPGTIASRISRCLARLRQALESPGPPLAREAG